MAKANFNVKDVLGKLSFLKNNLGLLVPILIVVVAVLLFIPTRILRGKLQTTIREQSVQMAGEIRSVASQAKEAARLAALEQVMNRYAEDANTIELRVEQATQRELLSYELFPDTNETSVLLFDRFGQKYLAGIEAMLTNLRAGAPPTDNEIEAALASAPRSPWQQRATGGAYGGAYGAYGGMPGAATPGMPGANRRFVRGATEMDQKIIDKMCLDKAREAGVYAGPTDLDGYTYWSEWKFEDRDTALRACWYWQVGYWILEDVTAAIGAINKDSDSVLTTPVKRLMNASFTLQRSRMSPGARGRRTARRDARQWPTYVASGRDGLTLPCTGRYSTNELDVVHFYVRVVVSADDVMPFMQELCRAKPHKFRGLFGDLPEQQYKHNQITILESDVGPVNKDGLEHFYHRYGDEAVVELTLICEYVFDVATYDKIQPKLVKQDIEDAMNAATKKK